MKHIKYPFGMNPTESQIESATGNLVKVYFKVPETTCSHRNECCKAGCPNMYFCEFLAIRRKFVDRWPKDKRLELTLGCLRYYVMGEGDRPCLFLGEDKMCSIYAWRHLKCRLYGLIPQKLYHWIVESVAQESGVKKEQLPLCSQCDQVRIRPECVDGPCEEKFPDGKIPEDSIRKMEGDLRDVDLSLGMPPAMQARGFGFLTYHDWHLLCELGPAWLEKLSEKRKNCDKEAKEQFLLELKTSLMAASK